MFKKNLWKWSAAVVVLILAAGIIGLSSAKGAENNNGNKESSQQVLAADKVQETAAALASSPSPDEQVKPQVEVPVDMEIVKNDQKSVDQGHSPWQMDPVQVTMTFVSLLISPGGVQGEFPVKWEDLHLAKSTDKDAVVEVTGDKYPVSRVYLKRLVRQDSSGIWSVVGYDLPENGKK